MIPQTIPDALTWAGTAAGLSAIAAFLIERLKGFQALSSAARRWVITVALIVIAVGSNMLLRFIPPETWAALQPYYAQALTAIIVAWSLVIGEAAHRADKALFLPKKEAKRAGG